MGKIFGHSGKSYWQGKFWQISNSQCICRTCFPCICEYLARKILANGSQFAKFANFSPTKIFLCTPVRYILDSLRSYLLHIFQFLFGTPNYLESQIKMRNLVATLFYFVAYPLIKFLCQWFLCSGFSCLSEKLCLPVF